MLIEEALVPLIDHNTESTIPISEIDKNKNDNRAEQALLLMLRKNKLISSDEYINILSKYSNNLL